jgi:hypothetical protein
MNQTALHIILDSFYLAGALGTYRGLRDYQPRCPNADHFWDRVMCGSAVPFWPLVLFGTIVAQVVRRGKREAKEAIHGDGP